MVIFARKLYPFFRQKCVFVGGESRDLFAMCVIAAFAAPTW